MAKWGLGFSTSMVLTRLTRAGLGKFMACQGAQPSGTSARTCQENTRVQILASDVNLTQGAFTLDSGPAPVLQHVVWGSLSALEEQEIAGYEVLGTEAPDLHCCSSENSRILSFRESSDMHVHSISRIFFLHKSLSWLLLQAFLCARKHCHTLPVKSRSCHWEL